MHKLSTPFNQIERDENLITGKFRIHFRTELCECCKKGGPELNWGRFYYNMNKSPNNLSERFNLTIFMEVHFNMGFKNTHGNVLWENI